MCKGGLPAPCPPPPAPAPLISNPAALCVLGVGGDEPRSPRRPPGRRTGLGGGDTQRFGGLQKMGRGRGFAWEGAEEEEEEDVTEHPWGPAGGFPTARNLPCSPVFVCACFTGRGGAGLSPSPPAPGTSGHAAGPPQGQSARGVPPGPGLPLTRSLHRQHPDSSVRLFVCFKYIYIIYINILIYLGVCGAQGHRHRTASPSAPELKG